MEKSRLFGTQEDFSNEKVDFRCSGRDALMALVSCGKSDHFDPNTLEQSTVGELSFDVTMRLSQEEFRSVPSELSLVITNHTGEEYTYGSEYRLEVYLDDQWYILPAEEELYFTSIGVMLQPDGINSENIAPEEYPGTSVCGTLSGCQGILWCRR